MPLTQLSLVNNSVSPRTSESFFLQTRCGGIERQEVLRNNRPTHGAGTAVSPRAGHVSMMDCTATTPPQPSTTSAPSSRSMPRPTSRSVPRFLEQGQTRTISHRRERRSSWLGLWSMVNRLPKAWFACWPDLSDPWSQQSRPSINQM